MDYEIAENLVNVTDISSATSREFLGHEIVISLACLVAFCADVLTVYTMFYFKQMRTISNILLGNWVIADVFCILVTPSGYRVLSTIANFNIPYDLICGAMVILMAFRAAEILFATAVGIDWLSGVYFPRLSEKIKTYYKFIIGFLWIYFIINSSIGIGLCTDFADFFALEVTLYVSYCVLLFLVIICLITIVVHKCSKRPLTYVIHPVMLTTSMVVGYFLGFVFTVFHVHTILNTFAITLIYFNSIVNLIILYFFHRDFKANLLKITDGSGSGYSESLNSRNNNLLNNENSDVPVQIAFHHPTEELISNAY